MCQDCNKREASIHLTQIINNEKIVLNLCKTCAEKRGFHSPFEQVPFPLAEIVTGMVGPLKPKSKGKSKAEERPDLRCPRCGMTFSEFGKIGRLGCAGCYDTFRVELSDLLRRIHGSAEHRGHIAETPSEELQPLREEKRLKDELKKAIESEDFEMAAEIRDRIKQIAFKAGKEDK